MTHTSILYQRIHALLNAAERRIDTMPRGSRTAACERIKTARERARGFLQTIDTNRPRPHLVSRQTRVGLGLARQAGIRPAEGSTWSRGDHITAVRVLDVVFAPDSVAAPYFDSGHAGLALVEVERRRVYPRTAKIPASYATTRFLVGRNEAGTFFSHAVGRCCSPFREAVDWMWHGLADRIVARQGDIAIVAARGPQLPAVLPAGHRIEGDQIVHATHSAVSLPGKGKRVIVARRADARATAETRD